MSSSPADLGLLQASGLLRTGRLSAPELVDACLRRIEERNGGSPSLEGGPDRINAWVRVYPELARQQATAAGRRLQRERDAAPPLCGVPLALKDLYAVRGLPLSASSRVLEGNVADRDASVWSRLEEAGLVLLGHTHTHEFAAGGTTDQVGNPWALDRVAGGSSGGSAAVLASRMAPAALGTDTCGSLRIPSACCGTSAIKPTYGRTPLDGIIPLAPSLDHPGPMARSVADCSALLHTMTASDPAALVTAAQPRPRPLGGLRVAVSDRMLAGEFQARVAQEFERAVSACAALGATIVECRNSAQLDWSDLSLVLLSEMWAFHCRYRARHDRYRPSIAEMVELASKFTDAQAYIGAQQRRVRLTEEWDAWYRVNQIDLLIEPTLPILPGVRGHGYDRGHGGGAGDAMIGLTALWDMTGMPVVSLPVSWDVGVSLIAPRGHEAMAIQAGIDLQEHELGIPNWPADRLRERRQSSRPSAGAQA